MILRAYQIARELEEPTIPDDPMVITPMPDLKDLKKSGAASVDIRLGRWFLECRRSHAGLFDVYSTREEAPDEASLG